MKPVLNAILFVFALLAVSNVSGQKLPFVNISTDLGEIVVEVDTIRAPVTANNFLKHIELDSYQNGVFYRVVRLDNQPNNDVKIEVIQGGTFTEIRFEKIEPISHETTRETGIKHLDGTISMARREPGTASTEFFICVGAQPELDYEGKRNPDGQGFAAFGHVVSGMDVVRKIQEMNDKNQTLVEKVKFDISIKKQGL